MVLTDDPSFTGTRLVQLRTETNTWELLLEDWRRQCELFDEDITLYEDSPINVVRDLAEGPLNPNAGAYALYDGERFSALCQANRTPLPGYTGQVLRVRMMYLCPELDLGDSEIDDYVTTLTQMFSGIVSLSSSVEMAAPHIKFHLRSPADRQFFQVLSQVLSGDDSGVDRPRVFANVQMRGSWLYITK